MNVPPLLHRCPEFKDRCALVCGETQLSYDQLFKQAGEAAKGLLQGKTHLESERIGLAAEAGWEYVCLLWGIWRAGGVAVPISLAAGPGEIAYTLEDAEISRVLCSEHQREALIEKLPETFAAPLGTKELKGPSTETFPEIDSAAYALIIYTSGTTSKPKGVPLSHANLLAQVESLCEAWEWQASDSIPLFLPLHHLHGLVNILCCGLYSGAKVETLPRFDMGVLLQEVSENAYSVFMAVPTVYVKLIEAITALSKEEQAPVCAGFKSMRLMVSGSAALPVSVHRRWHELTEQVLLERYGMTEIGMALSNPFSGERRPGTVGQPLPGVSIRLIGEAGQEVEEKISGEIQIRGPGVFKGYLNRPKATKEAFVDGWFRSGDIACWENGYLRILGRSSIDIIKSGGYKLSALEIETHLLDHPSIREIAVVALPDETWGESVAAALVLQPGLEISAEELTEWSKSHMSAYKIPRKWWFTGELPRNAMGKVMKPKITQSILDQS